MAAGQVTPAQIASMAKGYGLDPNAVLAVAKQEGLGGGIGDNNTSFGPLQLHQGGAYPTFAPQDAAAAQQWAWSPAGVTYALSRMAGVAKGLTGRNAINALVTQFERPANPQREIAGANAAYGSSFGATAPTVPSPGLSAPEPRAPLPGAGGGGGNISAALKLLGFNIPAATFNPGTLTAPTAPTSSTQLSVPGAPTAATPGLVNPIGNGAYERVDQGVDYMAKTPVRALAPGTITAITKGMAGGTGDIIKEHLDRPVTVNGHTYQDVYYSEESPLVRQGQRVAAGQNVMAAGGNELGFLNPNGQMAPLVGGLGAGTKPTGMGADFLALLRQIAASGSRP